MPLVILEAVAKSECVDQVVQLLKANLPETRAYDGCQYITCFLNEDGKTFVFVEHWDSKAHYEKYLAWRAETGLLAELVSLFETEPSIRYFETVDA